MCVQNMKKAAGLVTLAVKENIHFRLRRVKSVFAVPRVRPTKVQVVSATFLAATVILVAAAQTILFLIDVLCKKSLRVTVKTMTSMPP